MRPGVTLGNCGLQAILAKGGERQESGISKGKQVIYRWRRSQQALNEFLLGHPETMDTEGSSPAAGAAGPSRSVTAFML